MITPDTSIVVAALVPWRAAHEVATRALVDAEPRLIAHVAWETVSTLSPNVRRTSRRSGQVTAALEREFSSEWLCMDGATACRHLRHAVDAGIRGGALYDERELAAAHGVR